MQITLKESIDAREQERWKSFLESSSHRHPEQSLIYADILRAQKRRPLFAIGEEGGKIVAVGLIGLRRCLGGLGPVLEARCVHGPVFDDIDCGTEFVSLLMNKLFERHVGALRIQPYWKFPEATQLESAFADSGLVPHFPKLGTRMDTGLVDITVSLDDIWKSFSKWTRRDIRRLEKFEVDIQRVDQKEKALESLQSLQRMRANRGLTQMSSREFEASFNAIFHDGKVGVLFDARREGEFLGGLWLQRCSETAHPVGYAIEPDRCQTISNSLSVGPGLWWRGIQWAHENECKWLDVQGFNPATKKTNPIYHIHEFKSRFRPKPINILGELSCAVSHKNYCAYKFDSLARRALKFGRSIPFRMKMRRLQMR